jgi:predicted nucleic acid-binding Zn ribbon protein
MEDTMPIYEYYCPECNPGGTDKEKLKEIWVKPGESNTGPPVPDCETCGETMKRALSVVSHSYKGSGFYATDYKEKPPKKEGGKR